MTGRTVAVLALACTLSSCSLVDPDLSGERDALERARERWESVGPSSYRVIETRFCFCGGEGIGPVAITVTPAGITRVYVEDQRAVAPAMERFFPTVDQLFEDVAMAIDRGDYRVEARYHPVTGAPEEVYIDQDEMLADEEVRWVLEVPQPL